MTTGENADDVNRGQTNDGGFRASLETHTFIEGLPNIDGREPVIDWLADSITTDGEEGYEDLEALLGVAFGHPKKSWFMVHADQERAARGFYVKDFHSPSLYAVTKSMLAAVGSYAKPCIYRQGVTTRKRHFIIPEPIITPDSSDADKSIREVIRQAIMEWRRLKWVTEDFRYKAEPPQEDLGKPSWPTEDYMRVLELGLQDVIIRDHSQIHQRA